LTFLLLVTTAFAESRQYTLQEAYDAALKAHEVVKISEENVLQAESRTDQAFSHVYPSLTGSGSYTRFNETLPPDGGPFIFQPLNQVNASLVLTQPLYTGGRTMAAWRVAKTLRETSRNDLATTKQAIMLGVAEAYYSVIKAENLVEATRNSLARMERHKKVTEREAATRRSKANMSALLRANTLVNQVRIALVRAEDGLTIAKEKLGLLTRLPEDIGIVEPAELPAPRGSMTMFQDTALKNRDDYTNAQLNQKVTGEFVTITKGGHYPQLSAEAGVRYQNSSPETALDATTYYAGLRLQIPIFEGGLMQAEVAEAKSRLRQSEYASALLKRQIESEVHEAFINYQTVNSVFGAAKLQLSDAKKNFDTVEGLFSQGLMPSLSLIDAESTLSLTEKELINATWDRQLAILRLEKSLGLLGKNFLSRMDPD
jgi:outer membrane protein